MFDGIELGELETNVDNDLILTEDYDYSFIKSILNSDDLEIVSLSFFDISYFKPNIFFLT